MIEFLKTPKTPKSPVIVVPMTPRLRRKIERLAIARGVSVQEFGLTAVDGLVRACEAEVQLTKEPLQEVGRA